MRVKKSPRSELARVFVRIAAIENVSLCAPTKS
jgi:hypothetical protein